MRIAALVAATVAVGAGAQAAQADVDLEATSATQLESMMSGGQLTSAQLTRDYLNRIAAVNLRGPALNAVRSLNPDAMQEARQSDLIRATSGPRGPLEGLPVLLKDNIDVAGIPTTAGSIVLEHSVPDKDATIVKKLKAAGAVILGKVNLTEFAAWVSNNQSSGNSSLGGQVLNPYDLSTDPGGSSAGSGVAAAAGLAALTIGSDTEGSIISPASQNGVVGVRPSTGLLSRHGIVPISFTQDTAGPLTQTVTDAAEVLNATAGVDPLDAKTADDTQVAGVDYTANLKTTALQGARIGVQSSSNAIYQAAVAKLQALGATTVPITLPSFTTAQSIQTREFRRDLDSYLSELPANAPIKSYEEAYAYFHDHPQEGLKYGDSRFGPPAQYHLENPDEEAEYEQVRDYEVNRARTYLDTIMDQGAGSADDLDGILQLQLGLISQAAFAGYPDVSVPGGFTADTGRPANVTFIGRRFSEQKLLGYAYAYEQATHNRKPPSQVNPASWRCVAGEPAYDPQGCGPFAGFAGPLSASLLTPALDLEHIDIPDIKRRFAAGTLTSSQLVQAYLDRIKYVNNQGPGIDAVRAINPAATAEAAAADAARAAGTASGPLAGIPVLVNDTVDVAGMATSAGSMALQDVKPSADAAIVRRLKAAGAIVLGKTNVTELNGMVASGMPAGYAALDGQVLNPYDMRVSIGSASAGALAAAASGLAAATVGEDVDATTSGTGANASNSASPSATVGAAATSVVAMRPSFGLVSRSGILTSAKSQETPVAIGSDVENAASVLSGLVGSDPADDATAAAPSTAPDYAAGLSKSALAGKRIGVIAPTSGASAAAFSAAVSVITGLGATAVPLTAPSRPSTAKVVATQVRHDLDAYLAPYGKSTADVVAYNDAHPADELKFNQSLLRTDAAIDLSNPSTAATYQTNMTTGRTLSQQYIDTLLANGGAPVDAILSTPAVTAEVGIRAGYPQVTLPDGYNTTNRGPLAISFTGTAGDDAKLLGFAYAYERAALIRQTPSENNPQTWHCVAPIVYQPRTCGPGEPVADDGSASTSVTTQVGGTVAPTLSLTLGGAVSLGSFVPGVARTYTGSTTASVVSSAADALLTVSGPTHLSNGSSTLPQPLQVSGLPKAYMAPIANDPVTIGFAQAIGANDALRTGSYAATLTFTLSTDAP